MCGVREVRQLDDRRLHWVAEIAGVRREWDASVLEQEPDRKVAWAATSGATNVGAVRFEAAGPSSTFVYLTLQYRSEEYTSALESRQYLVCCLLLEKKYDPHGPAPK